MTHGRHRQTRTPRPETGLPPEWRTRTGHRHRASRHRPSWGRPVRGLVSGALLAVLLAGCSSGTTTAAPGTPGASGSATGGPVPAAATTAAASSSAAASTSAGRAPSTSSQAGTPAADAGTAGGATGGAGTAGGGSGTTTSGGTDAGAQGSGDGTEGLPGWPIESTPTHGARLWAAYLAVGSPGDPALQQVLDDVRELWPGAGLGELSCDEGAAQALGRDGADHAVAVYFPTEQHITEFRRRWEAPFLAAAQVTTRCAD